MPCKLGPLEFPKCNKRTHPTPPKRLMFSRFLRVENSAYYIYGDHSRILTFVIAVLARENPIKACIYHVRGGEGGGGQILRAALRTTSNPPAFDPLQFGTRLFQPPFNPFKNPSPPTFDPLHPQMSQFELVSRLIRIFMGGSIVRPVQIQTFLLVAPNFRCHNRPFKKCHV